jgi:hypothetical protein
MCKNIFFDREDPLMTTLRNKLPFLRILLTLALLLFSSGCAEMQSGLDNMKAGMENMTKTATGTLAGAATGAVAGGLATGDMRGVVVGAIIGGFVGNRIGAYLDERDQEKLRELQLQALKTGKEQSFVTNKTGDQVTLTPGELRKEALETYEIAGDLKEYELIPANELNVDAFVNTPVYTETNAKKKPRYVLQQGSALHVPVRVAGQKGWGAVVEKNPSGGGQVVGYVPLSYLDPKTAKAYRPPVSAKKAAKKPAKTTVAKAVKAPPAQQAASPQEAQAQAQTAPPQAAPPQATPPQAPGSDGGVIFVNAAPKSEMALQKAVVMGNCKVIKIKVKGIFEDQRFCEKPPPQWVQI